MLVVQLHPCSYIDWGGVRCWGCQSVGSRLWALTVGSCSRIYKSRARTEVYSSQVTEGTRCLEGGCLGSLWYFASLTFHTLPLTRKSLLLPLAFQSRLSVRLRPFDIPQIQVLRCLPSANTLGVQHLCPQAECRWSCRWCLWFHFSQFSRWIYVCPQQSIRCMRSFSL